MEGEKKEGHLRQRLREVLKVVVTKEGEWRWDGRWWEDEKIDTYEAKAIHTEWRQMGGEKERWQEWEEEDEKEVTICIIQTH